jgi:hypothetical protein
MNILAWFLFAFFCGSLLFLLVAQSPGYLLAVWVFNFILLAWKYRQDLSSRPSLHFPGRQG